ncbi:MAG: hypothetical protein ACW981_11735 [Candidatus Hodarchaeales archaeon]|jgi:hypothetical protein
MASEEDREIAVQLIDELSSYIYGVLILIVLSCVMLLLHLGLDFFFHNP